MKALVQSMVRFDPGRQALPLRRPALSAQGLRSLGPQRRHADDAKDLATELAELVADESLAARMMIVIEDVPQFADSSAERALKALFQAVKRSEHLLIGDADTARSRAASA